MTIIPIDPVARALIRHWHAGLKHPDLKEAVCGEFPNLTVERFNSAADIAWAIVGEGAA